MPKSANRMQSSDAEIVHSLNSPPPGISYVDKALHQGGMPALAATTESELKDPNSELRKRMDNEQAELWAMVMAHQETIKMNLQIAEEKKTSLLLQQKAKETERGEEEKRDRLADQLYAEREKERQAQEQLAQQLKKLEADKAQMQEMLQKIREQKVEVQKQLTELRTELGSVQKQIQVLEGEIRVKRDDVMDLERQHEDLAAAQREAVRRLDEAAITQNKGLRERLYNDALQNYQDMENFLDRVERENKERGNNPKVQAEIDRRRQQNKEYLASVDSAKNQHEQIQKGVPKVLEDVQKYRKEQALPEIHKNEQARLTTLMFDIRAAAADKMNLKEVQILPAEHADIFAPAAGILGDNAKKQRKDIRKEIDSFPEQIRQQQDEIMKIRYRQDKVQAQLVAAREELDSMMNKQSTLKTQVMELQEKIRTLDKNLENLELLEQNTMREIRVLEDQQIEARKGRPFVSPAISEAAREIHLPPVPSPSHVDGVEQQEGVSQISSPIPSQHLGEEEHIPNEPEHLNADRAESPAAVQDNEEEEDAFAAMQNITTPNQSDNKAASESPSIPPKPDEETPTPSRSGPSM